MSIHRSYTGRSGQMAVLAELLIRRCNAAVPEVDVGTDLFAFHDEREEVARLQVKTSQGERYKRGDGHSAQFSLPIKQLERPDRPSLFYALVVRLDERFIDFLVIGRSRLADLWNGPRRFGTRDPDDNLVLTVQFRDRVMCGEADLTDHRGPGICCLPCVRCRPWRGRLTLDSARRAGPPPPSRPCRHPPPRNPGSRHPRRRGRSVRG